MLRATTLSRAAVAAALAIAFTASVAGAALRSPQVSFVSGPLQAQLTALDGGINVTTDQQDAQVFTSGYTGNTDFTLYIKNVAATSYGLYTGTDPGPTLNPLFSPAALNGYRALCHFDNTNGVTVQFQDQDGNPIGSTFYSPINRNYFGFYVQGGSGTWFSQDGRNGPNPQVLAFNGTGANYGETFLCFQSTPYNGESSTFDDAIIVLQSVVPTPTHNSTWGRIKATYR
jgi:hypothetical protein